MGKDSDFTTLRRGDQNKKTSLLRKRSHQNEESSNDRYSRGSLENVKPIAPKTQSAQCSPNLLAKATGGYSVVAAVKNSAAQMISDDVISKASTALFSSNINSSPSQSSSTRRPYL